jgi:hypothetical protein
MDEGFGTTHSYTFENLDDGTKLNFIKDLQKTFANIEQKNYKNRVFINILTNVDENSSGNISLMKIKANLIKERRVH